MHSSICEGMQSSGAEVTVIFCILQNIGLSQGRQCSKKCQMLDNYKIILVFVILCIIIMSAFISNYS